jgi:hypothetical protein
MTDKQPPPQPGDERLRPGWGQPSTPTEPAWGQGPTPSVPSWGQAPPAPSWNQRSDQTVQGRPAYPPAYPGVPGGPSYPGAPNYGAPGAYPAGYSPYAPGGPQGQGQWAGGGPPRSGRSKALIVVPLAVIIIAGAVIGLAIGAHSGSSSAGPGTTVGIGTSTTVTDPAATIPTTPITTTPTTASPTATTLPSGIDDDQIYLQTVRSASPSLAKLPDAQLISVGHQACTQLLAGSSLTMVVSAVRPSLLPADPGDLDIASLVGAAIGEYCPTVNPGA